MGADYIVGLECIPKAELGKGDPQAGSAALVQMLKMSGYAAVIREHADRSGEDPAAAKISIRRQEADGSTSERGVSLSEMEMQATGVSGLASHCQTCPANALGRPFGCSGFMKYPVSEANERWLVGQVQPADSLGGNILAAALRDFGYSGATAAKARAAGMFESRAATKKILVKKLFRKVEFSADQLFEAMFFVGGLAPGHCLGILLWLGAIEFDGRPLLSPDEAPRLRVLTSLPVSERLARTRLAVRDQSAAAGVDEAGQLLGAMLTAWQNNVPLHMDA